MTVHRIVNSVFNSCTYIVHEEGFKEAILIDCGDVEQLIDYLREKGLKLGHILLTHSHIDHIYGLNDIIKLMPSVKVMTNIFGVEGLKSPKLNLSHYHADIEDFVFIGSDETIQAISDSDTLNLNGIEIKTIPTPGHDPSCVSYLINNQLFTGDSYIPGIKVVSNWPKSNKKQALLNETLLKNLSVEKILSVFSGHLLNYQ